MSTKFTPEQRQMIEDMSQWDSLPRDVRDILAEQIKDTTWSTLPTGTPVIVTANWGGQEVEFIGYVNDPDRDGEVKLARRTEDGGVSDRWVQISDITSVTVLTPADDTDGQITVSGAKRTTRNGVEYVLLDDQAKIDAYAAKHGNGVIGLDFNGDSKVVNPDSRAYRPWAARADGTGMTIREIYDNGYQLVRDLTNSDNN